MSRGAKIKDVVRGGGGDRNLTAWQLAAENGNLELFKLLVSKRGNIHMEDNGESCLIYICFLYSNI